MALLCVLCALAALFALNPFPRLKENVSHESFFFLSYLTSATLLRIIFLLLLKSCKRETFAFFASWLLSLNLNSFHVLRGMLKSAEVKTVFKSQGMTEQDLEEAKQDIPIGRVGQPEDIAVMF